MMNTSDGIQAYSRISFVAKACVYFLLYIAPFILLYAPTTVRAIVNILVPLCIVICVVVIFVTSARSTKLQDQLNHRIERFMQRDVSVSL